MEPTAAASEPVDAVFGVDKCCLAVYARGFELTGVALKLTGVVLELTKRRLGGYTRCPGARKRWP